jgi:hypothetical protein
MKFKFLIINIRVFSIHLMFLVLITCNIQFISVTYCVSVPIIYLIST